MPYIFKRLERCDNQLIRETRRLWLEVQWLRRMRAEMRNPTPLTPPTDSDLLEESLCMVTSGELARAEIVERWPHVDVAAEVNARMWQADLDRFAASVSLDVALLPETEDRP